MAHDVSALLRGTQSWRNQINPCLLRKSLFLKGIPSKPRKIGIFAEFRGAGREAGPKQGSFPESPKPARLVILVLHLDLYAEQFVQPVLDILSIHLLQVGIDV